MAAFVKSLPLPSLLCSRHHPRDLLPPVRRCQYHDTSHCASHNAKSCSGGVAEKTTNRTHPVGGKRFAISFRPDIDFKFENHHNLWAVDDIDNKIKGNTPDTNLMQFQRDAYFRPCLDSWPKLVAQSCRGLNLAVTEACIRVLNIPCKDAVRLPGSWGLGLDGEYPAMKVYQQSASMEYNKRTGKYKIVRMLRTSERGPLGEGFKCRCETYTLGTNAEWEAAKPPPAYGLDLCCYSASPIFTNGAHHWLDRLFGTEDPPFQVVAFNADEGSYKLIPLPPVEEFYPDIPKMFLDRDSGNVCLLQVVPGETHGEDDFPVRLWILEADDGTDYVSSGNATWIKMWEGYLPEVAAFPVMMEGHRLLSWYDLKSKTVQIVAEKLVDNSESDSDCDYKPQVIAHFTPSVTTFDEELAPPDILQTEQKIISFRGLPDDEQC